MRLALECRRRVKEQQKRIGSAEFRNTQFSYSLGEDGVEKFVVTPELQSEDSIGDDPLPPARSGSVAQAGRTRTPGCTESTSPRGPAAASKILNQPAPPPFRESVRCAEQNLYARAKELVGDRDPRPHEFSVQLRAFDASKSGSATGVGVLLALCSALAREEPQGRDRRRRRAESRWVDRAGAQRGERRGSCGRQGRKDDAAASGHAETAERPSGRRCDAGDYHVLLRRT